jgi:hypothetical protein
MSLAKELFMFVILALVLGFSGFNTSFAADLPADGRVDIWPSIPFVRGADLCRYSDTYGQTRTQYMTTMTKLASQFYYGGVQSLIEFNNLYEKNVSIASQNNYLDVTLESTLKAYIDSYYRNLKPKTRKIVFSNSNEILKNEIIEKLDYVAYGTYAFAPNCQGDIQVTLHLVGRNGDIESYVGQGTPAIVMSQIASEIFTQFQRTQFPSEIKVGNNTITLLGGLSGSVDKVESARIAEKSCATINARLPNQTQLEILASYGDWSGGISFNEKVWAMSNNKVYASHLHSSTPVKDAEEINADEIYYYCVR